MSVVLIGVVGVASGGNVVVVAFELLWGCSVFLVLFAIAKPDSRVNCESLAMSRSYHHF